MAFATTLAWIIPAGDSCMARLRTHSCHSQKMTIAAMTMADMKV